MTLTVLHKSEVHYCGDMQMMSLQFAHICSFAYRSRLRNLRADCFTVGLYCITTTRHYIFKSSLQVTVVGVLPHVTRVPIAFFSTQTCFSSVTDLRIGQISHGLGPAQLLPVMTHY